MATISAPYSLSDKFFGGWVRTFISSLAAVCRIACCFYRGSEEHTSELQSQFHLLFPLSFFLMTPPPPSLPPLPPPPPLPVLKFLGGVGKNFFPPPRGGGPDPLFFFR